MRRPMPRSIVYLDYAATTPVDPAVVQAIHASLCDPEGFANASSASHALGRAAAERIEHARMQVAALIAAEAEEIVFTSGATESNNLAVLGAARANADRGRHIVSARTEHKSVLDACQQLEKEGFELSYLGPDATGRIDPQALRSALRADTILVSLMHVNNETGVVQDIAALGELCQSRGVVFHTDAAQSAGRIALDVHRLPVDLLSLTAHKIYGPKGIGALYVRRGARGTLRAVSFGGGQERGLRPGTLATHQIVGFGAAAQLAAERLISEAARIAALRDRLWLALAELRGIHLNGAGAPRVANILNVSFEDVEGESLVTALRSLAVATGSACNSTSAEPSYVLRALGRSARLAESSLRFSLGRFSTEADIDFAAVEVCREVARLRGVAPASRAERAARPGEIRAPDPAGAAAVAEDSRYPPALSALAAQLFAELPGAGVLEDGGCLEGSARVLRGEAGGPHGETWVRFQLLVAGDIVKDARFQAFGCPHTLATAAWITAQLRGRALSAGVPSEPQAWAQALGVPVEKLGRLLVVEDALRAALQEAPDRT